MSNHSPNQSQCHRADNSRSKHREVGVDADISDLIDRCLNGNQLEEGLHTTSLTVDDKTDERLSMSLFTLDANIDKDIGSSCDIGRVEVAVDGIGLKYNAHVAAINTAIGPVDMGAKIATAEASAKVWEPGVGLDVGLKANVQALQANVGPVNAALGVGFDTGVKFGKEGVGVNFLGTGVQIGRETKISLFGSSISFKWY